MNVLITNDDGIRARGLHELMKALREEAGMTVFICAPDGQRSASGHGITMSDPISVTEVEIEGAEMAFQTSGLPADCVKIGVELLRRADVQIDMVFSGINHGGNLGTDTLYSGTVAGAMEGSLCGYPSVAVSVDSHDAKHFEYACELAVNAAESLKAQIKEGTVRAETVLNINTPDLPREQVRGLKFTRLGAREYEEEFAPLDGGENMHVPGSFRYYGVPIHYEDLNTDIDVIASQENYASISPIHADRTQHHMIEEIKNWGLG